VTSGALGLCSSTTYMVVTPLPNPWSPTEAAAAPVSWVFPPKSVRTEPG